jgi:hypothetical protein
MLVSSPLIPPNEVPMIVFAILSKPTKIMMNAVTINEQNDQTQADFIE